MAPASQNAAFRRLVPLYALNLVIEWFGSVALMAMVYAATQSASLAALTLIAKQGVPGVVLPLLGPVLDRIAARPAIAALCALQAACLVLFGALTYGPATYGLAFLSGLAGAGIRTAIRAAIARSLDPVALRGGNALLNVVTGVTAPIGPAFAGVVVATLGAQIAFSAAGAAMALLTVAAIVTLGDLEPAAASNATADDADADAPAAAPARPYAGIPLAWLLAGVALIVCLFCMDQPALMAFSEDALHAGAGGYGAIFAAWGVGNGIGSVAFSRLLHLPMIRVYAIATGVSALALIGMGLSPSIWVACAFAVVGGIGNGMDWVAIVTVLQEATPRGREARTTTRLEAIGMSAPVAGFLLGGVLADLASPRVSVGAAGALALVVLAAGAVATRRAHAHRFRASRPLLLPSSIPGGSA